MISTIMQESKYIADTVEQKYVAESGKAFKVGVFWACSRDLARDIPNNLQEIKKKNSKDDENFSTKIFLIRKSIIANMLLFHRMVLFVCHYHCSGCLRKQQSFLLLLSQPSRTRTT